MLCLVLCNALMGCDATQPSTAQPALVRVWPADGRTAILSYQTKKLKAGCFSIARVLRVKIKCLVLLRRLRPVREKCRTESLQGSSSANTAARNLNATPGMCLCVCVACELIVVVRHSRTA